MTLQWKKNIGIPDMMLRIGISAGLFYVALGPDHPIHDLFASYVVAAVGGMNLFWALVRYCPLYAVAGINTCKTH